MKRLISWLGVCACAVSVACGSDDNDDGNGTQTLSAPVMESVMPMAGGLHVTWQNVQTDCEEIELERKTATVDYALVAKVPGTADNRHDATATGAVEYTYRVRCRKAAVYSAYSNEMSGTP